MVATRQDSKRQADFFSNLPSRKKKVVNTERKAAFNPNSYIIQLKSKDGPKEVDNFIEYECIWYATTVINCL